MCKCTACPSLGRFHVPSFGDPTARLFIIGQSPSGEDVKQKQPFVGRCGALLDLMLSSAELVREEVYVTNALKCHPPGNRPPMPTELARCKKSWLFPELRAVKPALVLVLGKDAFTTLGLPEKQWGHLNLVQGKTKFLVAYHPSYFLRQNNALEFVKVGVRVKEILDGRTTSQA